MNDLELDDALSQLGVPAGAQPQADAAAILARARLLAPSAPAPRPRLLSPALGGGLLAAGVLLGVAADRLIPPMLAPISLPVPVVVQGTVPAPTPVVAPEAAPALPGDGSEAAPAAAPVVAERGTASGDDGPSANPRVVGGGEGGRGGASSPRSAGGVRGAGAPGASGDAVEAPSTAPGGRAAAGGRPGALADATAGGSAATVAPGASCPTGVAVADGASEASTPRTADSVAAVARAGDGAASPSRKGANDPAGTADPSRSAVDPSRAAADAELAALLDEELPERIGPVEALDARPTMPTAADRRLPGRESTPREPTELPAEALAAAEAPAATVPSRTSLPLDLRVVAAGGGGASPGQDPHGGGEAMLGVAWRPALAGASRPEVALDAGVSAWDGPERLDWRFETRASAGLVLGTGLFRPAVDWTVSASVPLGDAALPDARRSEDEQLHAPFATGPALALVIGRDEGLRGRLGARVDLSPGVPAGGWQLVPEGFVALELPLGRKDTD